MTTNEFIKAVENLGYEAEKDDGWILIKYKGIIIACIFTKELYRMSSCFSYIDCGKNAGTLFALVFQYAITPIKDREEEKKYYLKHRWLTEGGFYRFVKHHTKAYGEKYELASWTYGDTSDMQYTLKEIEEIKKKFDTDLKDFELVEVEE